MSQLQQSFKITLQQDVIFNASSATLGGQQGLDYLPGSVFLGALASRCYAELSGDEAWQLFHSGMVRFHDALPLDTHEQPAWPVPLSWHYYKGEEFRSSDRTALDARKIFDPALHVQEPSAESRQPKQMRKGYVSHSGAWVQPRQQLRMKTAIDARQGTAAESQLFGYHSLDAGQTYLFTLEAEPEAAALFEKAVKQLTGTLRLGRSRSAQYGKALSERCEPGQIGSPLPATQASAPAQTLTLWLLSDLALQDEHGQATLQPQARYLGLPDTACWDKQHSYIRTRHYSPFNAYRQAYEQERQVISRGSVLRYRLEQPLTPAQLVALHTCGLHTESGLGRVAINPELLAQAQPAFKVRPDSKPSSSTTSDAHLATGSSILIQTLQSRHQAQQSYNTAEQEAQRLFKRLLDALDRARTWKGIPASQTLETAPGRSQWGIIKELASHHRHNPAQLWNTITGQHNGAHAIIGNRSGWELATGPGTNLGQVITQDAALLQYTNQRLLADVLGQLAALGLSSKQWQAKVEGTHSVDQGAQA